MPFSSLKQVGLSILTSMTALDVLAEPVALSATEALTTIPVGDGDTKKLIIAGVTSIITQVLLKLIENAKKRRTKNKTIGEVVNIEK